MICSSLVLITPSLIPSHAGPGAGRIKEGEEGEESSGGGGGGGGGGAGNAKCWNRLTTISAHCTGNGNHLALIDLKIERNKSDFSLLLAFSSHNRPGLAWLE